ncbi:MAG: protease pro-enzyme activation domain-containing protein [Bacillota bacterium]|nr:protease pro-enzyme activation domain-containing protein [Bacillota bacterium]
MCVRLRFLFLSWIAILFLLVHNGTLLAQTLKSRIQEEISSSSAAPLRGSMNPNAKPQFDLGRVSASQRLNGITMYFKPTAEQKAELDEVVKEQQTPGSPNYHKWLTPAEYAARFGLSDGDIAKIKSWLEAQGFTVDRVSNSHNSITFSGTVAQVESAFRTEIHSYQIGSERHFANSTEIAVPSALAGVVQSVRNLNDFRPKPFVRFHRQTSGAVNGITPQFTSGQSGSHYLQPGDVAVIYDINAAYNAGYTGAGQAIAVVGQSEILVSDIEAFQNAAGLSVKDPIQVLVPGSGTAAISSGDESESDLDLEYSGSIAKDATIYFVYVGNNQNYSVWDALQYAVDTKIAPIISMSYGACEPDLSTSEYSTLEAILEQGASQGQSIIVSSGDDGSTACYADVTSSTVTPTSTEEELAVNYPASSAYVTALGGTEFPSADVSSSNTTYWKSASGSDVVTSALSYIPEQVWNDDSATYGQQYGAEYALSAGGGGVSIFTPRPSWQAGVTGISTAPDYSKGYRMVPDISLDSSPNNAGYLYCTSDTSAWSTGQQASCNSGFRDASTQYLTVAGGTSFAAPIFAGMLAIINQKENSTGQGVVNTTLYSLAANATTYASAFHDITSGSNACTAGTSFCSTAGASEYAATTGYDEATGLGSVDLYNLLTSWPSGSSASLQATTTALTAATTTPAVGASDTITITVAPQSSTITTTPTGTLTVVVDGTTITTSLALSNGSATYSFSSSTTGAHIITATYSGDSTFAPSSGSLTVNVGGSSGTSSSGSFTLSATNVTVTQGSSGTSTVTVTSQNSYAGTVAFTLSTTSSSLSTYGCYDVNNVSVAANGTATTTLTIYTSESACSTTASVRRSTRHTFVYAGNRSRTAIPEGPFSGKGVPISAAILVGLLGGGLRLRKSNVWLVLICIALTGVLSYATGCGGSSTSSSTSTDVAPGTYTLTLDGQDTTTPSIAASTTLTLTVQ